MTREIKFRGRRSDGTWVYGDLTHTQRITLTGTEPCIRIAGYDVDEETIGQFTGLLDNKKVEIYEGDILQWGEDLKQVVEYRHGGFGYEYYSSFFLWGGNTNFAFNPLDTDNRFEVIGNIHDNPSLLKGAHNEKTY